MVTALIHLRDKYLLKGIAPNPKQKSHILFYILGTLSIYLIISQIKFLTSQKKKKLRSSAF